VPYVPKYLPRALRNIRHLHEWSTSSEGGAVSNPGKEFLYPYLEDWVNHRPGLDILEKRKIFCPYQDLNPGPSIL